MRIDGGVDEDTLDILASAIIERSLCASLGGGDNSLSVAGSIEGGLSYSGRGGNDSVEIADTGVIGRSADIRLGDGDNTVTHMGDIEGNLRVTSANEDDVVDVAETANVGGRTQIDLGVTRGGKGHHGLGGFFFGGFGGGIGGRLAQIGMQMFGRGGR